MIMQAAHLTAVPGAESAQVDRATPTGIVSEIPACPTKLSKREKAVWNHVTQALHEYGLIHRTDGMMLSIICRTYVRWVDAEERLADIEAQNGGTYIVTTPNGYEQPHQIFYVCQKLKKELLQWLPEAALTIPSFNKAVQESAPDPQGTLFDDPVESFRRRKAAIGMRAVDGAQ